MAVYVNPISRNIFCVRVSLSRENCIYALKVYVAADIFFYQQGTDGIVVRISFLKIKIVKIRE